MATVAQIRARTRVLADCPDTTFITDTQIDTLLAHHNFMLYSMLVDTSEDNFYSTYNITLIAGTETYDLPTDFYKACKVFYLEDDYRYSIRQFNLEELEYNENYSLVFDNYNLTYRVMGDKILFSPKSVISSGTMELWYIPKCKDISDGYEIDYTMPSEGFVEYISCGAAIDILTKSESDSSNLERKKAEIEGKIRAFNKGRQQEPQRIQKVRKR